MKINLNFFYLIIYFSMVTGCVSYKAKYRGDWQRHDNVDDPYFTVYLVGDGGNAPKGGTKLTYEHLKKELDKERASSAVVWLGDNIYPVGLPHTSSVYYEQGRHRLMVQLETMSNYKGYKFFVPGNHDWYTYGRIGLRRQELLVDSFLEHTPNPHLQKNFFTPDKGCGDPKVVELTEEISLLLMDSHWFLNEKARSGDQEVCGVQTPKQFIEKLQSEIKNQKDRSLIVASHHPPYTYAHHGGKFPLKDDFFPFTQKIKWLYLPLPVAGVIFNRMRLRLSEQDVYHPLYKIYRSRLIEALNEKGRSVVASGHEHTLQFIENENQYFIVSGAASKNNKVGMGKGSKFSIGEQGYVKLIFLSPKIALVQYIVPGIKNDKKSIVYEKIIEFE